MSRWRCWQDENLFPADLAEAIKTVPIVCLPISPLLSDNNQMEGFKRLELIFREAAVKLDAGETGCFEQGLQRFRCYRQQVDMVLQNRSLNSQNRQKIDFTRRPG